jgi:hypothetical protein
MAAISALAAVRMNGSAETAISAIAAFAAIGGSDIGGRTHIELVNIVGVVDGAAIAAIGTVIVITARAAIGRVGSILIDYDLSLSGMQAGEPGQGSRAEQKTETARQDCGPADTQVEIAGFRRPPGPRLMIRNAQRALRTLL